MNLPPRKVRIIRRAVRALRTHSQSSAGADGDLLGLSEIVADTRNGQPEDGALEDEELSLLRRLMESIDQREAEILRLRFGLDGSEPLTLKEIASAVGLSRERVRQIVDEALTRLNSQLNDDRPTRFYPENRTPLGEPMSVARARAKAVAQAYARRASTN